MAVKRRSREHVAACSSRVPRGLGAVAFLSLLGARPAFQPAGVHEFQRRHRLHIGDVTQRLPAAGCARFCGPCNRVPRWQSLCAADDAASDASTEPDPATETSPASSRLVMYWGALGVAAYLGYGVKKVVPIVAAGILAIDQLWQWCFLVATLGFFAYVEGYRGFQKGFAPRVVSRAWVVAEKFDTSAAEPSVGPKELLTKYGSAYLMTSISLSLLSFSTIYALLSAGFDVPAALAAVGFGGRCPAAKTMGTAALAYALHKAASPIRFPPTVALTTVVAGFMGKPVEQSDKVASTGPLWHKIFAPAFCIGYFHGSRQRVITSWCVTSVIFAVVVGVKRLAHPYRGIIDAGVMVGLAWGIASIIAIFAKSLMDGKPPRYDPSLPEATPYTPLHA